MQRLSSRGTFWNKRVFPLIWFGTFVPLRDLRSQGGMPAVFFIVLVLMAAFSYFVLKKVFFDLADETASMQRDEA